MSIDLKAPEVQAAINEAVEAAVTQLKAKNAELIAEVREARKGKNIDPAELDKLEKRVEELQGQLSEANKAAKDAKATADKATKALEGEAKFVQSLLVDNGLSEALVKAGVKEPAHLKAVKAMLAGQVQIVADGDKRVAKVGDKALGDFVTDWAKSDEGKFFVSAQQNSGGGAGGGNGAKGTQGKIDGTPAERAAYFRSQHPELSNQ